jgi:hypothetical protein
MFEELRTEATEDELAAEATSAIPCRAEKVGGSRSSGHDHV